ncbi:MAG: NAD(P)H-dependent glycerol-3-phosphate dehydrogenase [Bryobacteraceae bacterium]
MSRLAVVGAGSWGTALAIALAPRFHSVHLWARNCERADEIARLRENPRYLPGMLLPRHVDVSGDLRLAITAADIVLIVVPCPHIRGVLHRIRPHLSAAARVVSGSKGIEEATLCRMSQVVSEALARASSAPVVVLSGPTFAREVAAGEPAALVVASEDTKAAEEIQSIFSTPKLRLYVSRDVIGVELGAALKNVVAIGAGICRGLGLGSNSVAALVTRGLAEITRLAVTMGADPRTLSGLAGLGDLVLTATGDLSRNRFVGIQLGEGRKLDQILGGMSMVAEGVGTCRAAHQLGIERGVNLPIIDKMHEVLYESKDPREAVRELMERPLTSE